MCTGLSNRRFGDGPVGWMQSKSNRFGTAYRRLRGMQTMRIGVPNRLSKRTGLSWLRNDPKHGIGVLKKGVTPPRIRFKIMQEKLA